MFLAEEKGPLLCFLRLLRNKADKNNILNSFPANTYFPIDFFDFFIKKFSPLMDTLTVFATVGLTPFSAVQVYVPSSLLPACESRSDPFGIRADPREAGWRPGPESLVQETEGGGYPEAEQGRRTSLPSTPSTSVGSWVQRGGTERGKRKNDEKNHYRFATKIKVFFLNFLAGNNLYSTNVEKIMRTANQPFPVAISRQIPRAM